MTTSSPAPAIGCLGCSCLVNLVIYGAIIAGLALAVAFAIKHNPF